EDGRARRAGSGGGAAGLPGLPGGWAAGGRGVHRPAHGRPPDGDGADRRAASRCPRPGARRSRAAAARVGHSGRRSMSSSRIAMVGEEPAVIAAASNAALVARAGGGFAAEADPGAMIGQIQLVDVPDPGAAVERLGAARARILAAAEELTPGLCRRGAGPRDVEVRLVRSARGETMVVVHVLLDTGDAMGANAVNSLVEALGPM